MGVNFSNWSASLVVSGYPLSQQLGNYENEKDSKYFSAWQFQRQEKDKVIKNPDIEERKRFFYQISTMGGHSGSPVVVSEDK